MRNSLATSAKVWKLIQTLLSKVYVNGTHSRVGYDDLIRLRPKSKDHPFRATLANGVVKWKPGMLLNFAVTPSQMVITDNDGFALPDTRFTGYIGFRFVITPEAATSISSSILQYNYIRPGFLIASGVTLSTSTSRFIGAYRIDANTADQSFGFVPICYINNGETLVQILDTNVGLRMNMNHIDLIPYSF